MYYKNQLEELYEKIVASINISEEMFDAAEAEYKKLGKWIEDNTPQYDIDIYPQGSFALGTVVKPFDREDEYDLDLVCEYQKDYGLDARQLKTKEVRSILDRYARAKAIKEKRRCWQVTYAHNAHFHMDVVPAVKRARFISITDHNEEFDIYEYIGSNPKDYAEWFKNRQLAQYVAIKTNLLFEMRKSGRIINGAVDPIKEYKIKTPLQKAIQILKRHRDILFADDDNNIKPISIIITTLAAELYQNDITIYDTLSSFFSGAKSYIEDNKRGAEYHIDNPTYTGGEKENFAEKWNTHPERAKAFFDWLETAKHDLIDSFESAQDDPEVATILESSLGESVARSVFGSKSHVLMESSSRQAENAVVPYKVKQILCAPQRKTPNFALPTGNRVMIKATVTNKYGGTYTYNNDGAPIPKDSSIEFRACFSGVQRPFEVKWQVVNMGYEATRAGDLRGGFTSTGQSTSNSEHTSYTGSHSIQCFVLRKGRCVAKSRIFIVNVQ